MKDIELPRWSGLQKRAWKQQRQLADLQLRRISVENSMEWFGRAPRSHRSQQEDRLQYIAVSSSDDHLETRISVFTVLAFSHVTNCFTS